MRCPVNHVTVTQKFGNHKGVDFGWFSKDHHNQWIYACDDGEVIYNKKQLTGGYVIQIRHDSGYVSEYGHLLKDSQVVKEGMKVLKGQKIARMGKSGMVTGEHLHFGLYKGTNIDYKNKKNFVDPLRYINIYPNQTTKGEIANSIKRTKTAYNIPSEPLNIRYKDKHGKVVGHIYNGDEVETYYINEEGWNCCDNLRDYVCSNRYLK